MNTSKQVNVMIGLLFASFVILVGYLFNESNRQVVETEEITHRNAERGARLFVQNCRTCHDLEGTGGIGAAINNKAFWIYEEGNAAGVPATPEGEAEAIRKYLRETIECGRPGTYMATWSQRFGGPLSDTQVNHLVTLLTNDPTGKQDFWDLVIEEGHHADEEQFSLVLEEEFALTAALTEQLGREPTKEEIDDYRKELTKNEQLGSVVEEYGRHPTIEEITARSREVTVVIDPSALTVNTESCGNWAPETKAQFRGRDPFAAPGEETVSVVTPATPTPEPVDVSDADATVTVEMTEWDMIVEDPLPAGTIAFQVANAGAVAHEFKIIRSDVAADGLPIEGGRANEGGLEILAVIPEFAGGSTQVTTADLTPGQYLLFCNVPAHYQLGMAVSVSVE